MKRNTIHAWLGGMAVCAGLLLAAGCEDGNQALVITLTPETANLAGAGDTVVFVATPADDGLPAEGVEAPYLPLKWEITNPGLGRIVSSEGYSVVYESNGRVGQHAIIVRDQRGAEGVAAIEQRKP